MSSRNSRRIWFFSDPHFGHQNVLKFEPKRKQILKCETIDQHDEALIKRYNKLVRPHDLVYFLGDLGFESYDYLAKIISRLNGVKHLVRGNHDKFSDEQYRRLGFVSVYYRARIKLGKTYFNLAHHPYKENWLQRFIRTITFRKQLRDNDKRPVNDGSWLIHGHVHSRGNKIPYKKQIHVGVDVWDMNPVSWEQIQKIINKE
jgi:calcineurin-like phosphoesterase family protein